MILNSFERKKNNLENITPSISAIVHGAWYRIRGVKLLECAIGSALLSTLFLLPTVSTAPATAADDLSLRKGISFIEDTDIGFPILAKNLNDVRIDKGVPVFIFFGASGDLNTNRQAKKVVSLYDKFKDKQIKFIIVDVDHPERDDVKALIKKYYKGYIPYQIVLGKQGSKVWEATGEVKEKSISKVLEGQL